MCSFCNRRCVVLGTIHQWPSWHYCVFKCCDSCINCAARGHCVRSCCRCCLHVRVINHWHSHVLWLQQQGSAWSSPDDSIKFHANIGDSCGDGFACCGRWSIYVRIIDNCGCSLFRRRCKRSIGFWHFRFISRITSRSDWAHRHGG